jgi:hypothetical protein
MEDDRLEFIGILNDAWSGETEIITSDTVYAAIAVYDRISCESKAKALRFVKMSDPASWNAKMWAIFFSRMLENADNESERILSENQKERAAIMEYDAYCPRWHAEDRALGRRRCPLEGPEIESQEKAAGLWCEYACET